MFFKGYVETKNKKCIEKFKNRTDFKDFEQVQSLPEFAGILAEKTILVDVDDFEQSEILFKIVKDKGLKCRVYGTTRGKHFLFNNPEMVTSCRTHCTLAVGITADIKLGTRNSYEVLKYDGKMREIIYDKTGADEKAEDLPKWMLPIKTQADFIDLKAGDGRNQGLFNYILTLQSNDFEVEEARETIRIINQYVMKDPLDDEELEVVLRDEAFAKPVFYKGNSFLFDKFAVFLKNNHHILRINGALHLYKDGIYIPGHEEIENAMIQHLPNLNRAKRKEVLDYLDIMIRQNTATESSRYIAFQNGLLDILDGGFVPFTSEHIITNKIPWDWNPDAYYALTDEVMNNVSCNDPEIRSLLEEMMGACLYRSNNLAGGKAFILTGTGANGKSTFLDMVKEMLGKKNLSVLDLNELNDRFSTVMMFGKLANIGDDISDEFVTNAAKFKKIVTGQTISAEQKGVPKFDFDPYCKLIFSANNIPRMGKGRDSGAIIRRLVIIPFNANFSQKDDPEHFKPFIGEELKNQESMEYLLTLAVAGLKRVLLNKAFTNSAKVQEELDEYDVSNNPVLGFFKESEDDEDIQIANEPTKNVYKKYQEYCLANSLTPLSAGEFSKQVKRHYGLQIIDKKIGGKKYRIFVES
jgi:putative DNA primase/helicase